MVFTRCLYEWNVIFFLYNVGLLGGLFLYGEGGIGELLSVLLQHFTVPFNAKQSARSPLCLYKIPVIKRWCFGWPMSFKIFVYMRWLLCSNGGSAPTSPLNYLFLAYWWQVAKKPVNMLNYWGIPLAMLVGFSHTILRWHALFAQPAIWWLLYNLAEQWGLMAEAGAPLLLKMIWGNWWDVKLNWGKTIGRTV